MKRYGFLLYGILCHLMFLGVFFYMAGFIGNILVPKGIDSPAEGSFGVALAVNTLLILAFVVPHSVMARPRFKKWWTQFVPKEIERSTYVLVSNLLMIFLMWQWRPLGGVVWDVQSEVGRGILYGLFAVGWLMVPLVSLLINHFDLFGTRQVWLYFKGKEYTPLPFRTPVIYKKLRHPLYVGWMIAFWATPTMTIAHLLFAVMTTAYMILAIPHEERDLVDHIGEHYSEYRKRVPALIPMPGKGVKNVEEVTAAVEQAAI